jgi:hypothetical protein
MIGGHVPRCPPPPETKASNKAIAAYSLAVGLCTR